MIWRFTFEQTPIHATRILTAICQFLQTYPLDPVPAPDSQPYTDSNQRVETVLMTDPRAQPTKPTVACFLEFKRTLRQHITSCSMAMQSTSISEYTCAKQIYDAQLFTGPQANVISQIAAENCFETARLSANMALDPSPTTASHPSSWAVIALVGMFNGGNVGSLDLGRVCSVGTNAILALPTQYGIQSFPFVG